MSSIQPINFEVSGKKYQTIPLTGFTVVQLDRKVTGLSMKAFSSIGGLKKPENGKGFIPLIISLAGAIQSMSDADYASLISATLQATSYIGASGERDILLKDDAIGDHFCGHLPDLYQVVYKVWEANKLTPFGIVDLLGD